MFVCFTTVLLLLNKKINAQNEYYGDLNALHIDVHITLYDNDTVNIIMSSSTNDCFGVGFNNKPNSTVMNGSWAMRTCQTPQLIEEYLLDHHGIKHSAQRIINVTMDQDLKVTVYAEATGLFHDYSNGYAGKQCSIFAVFPNHLNHYHSAHAIGCYSLSQSKEEASPTTCPSAMPRCCATSSPCCSPVCCNLSTSYCTDSSLCNMVKWWVLLLTYMAFGIPAIVITVIIMKWRYTSTATKDATMNVELQERTDATSDELPLESHPEAQYMVESKSQAVDKDLAEKSSLCWSADSWVITYPDMKRKCVNDIKVGDVILTYDELQDKYIWDELLIKLHFDEKGVANKAQIPMREFILSNDGKLSLTDNHLLFTGNKNGLYRADEIKIGDNLKLYDGSYVEVIGMNENVMKYPRNILTYNGNLVINGIAISSFAHSNQKATFWAPCIRTIMAHLYSYNIYRYSVYYLIKLWKSHKICIE